MGRAGCAHAALLLARLRFTRRVRVAPRHSSLPPPSRDSNICSPRRLGCPSCPSHARLCRATRTSVLPIASVALLALRALVCAGAPLEHLFSPSPRLPFLPSRARLCRATRTFVFPIAPGCPSRASRALGLLARAARHPPADHRRARHLPADYRRAARARRLSTAWAWACAGAGMCQGYL